MALIKKSNNLNMINYYIPISNCLDASASTDKLFTTNVYGLYELLKNNSIPVKLTIPNNIFNKLKGYILFDILINGYTGMVHGLTPYISYYGNKNTVNYKHIIQLDNYNPITVGGVENHFLCEIKMCNPDHTYSNVIKGFTCTFTNNIFI